MASPNRTKARPALDNRAQSISVGTRPADRPFNPEDLEASVVETTSPAEYSLGNPSLPEDPQADKAPSPQESGPQGQPVTEQAPAPEAPAEPDEVDDERFKGKPKKALYEAYKNLERLHGEHSAEVATYRKLYENEILKPRIDAEKARQQPPAEQPSNPNDDTALLNEMLTSPTKFRQKLQEDAKKALMDDLVQKANAHSLQQTKQSQQAILAEPEFQKWLVANVPQHLAAQADNDPATFNFVLNSYKSTRPGAAPNQAGAEDQGAPSAEQIASANPVPQIPQKPANVDRRIPVGNAVGVPAASRQTAAPAFTMGQLANMQLNHPAEYARRQPEIMAWYEAQQRKQR